MCRLLYARGEPSLFMPDLLQDFANMAQDSAEYQGHGWGCAWLVQGQWRQYHDIKPVWEDDFRKFGNTNLLIAHARSAFRDEGIEIANNMPFTDGVSMFAFNGELRGVRIKSAGRIGAEKIYNYIRRFDRGDLCAATAKAVDIIHKRSAYVRALNLILSDGRQTCVCSHFNENPDYFQLYQTRTESLQMVCSQPLASPSGWSQIENHTTFKL